MKARALAERFWEKVEKTEECWLWTAARFPSGYGLIRERRSNRPAHRVSWEWVHGPIPAGGQILHHCDVRHCVRPTHLFLGDNTTNVADRVAKGRSGGAAGAKNSHAKLTVEDVAEIRRLYQPAKPGQPRKGQSSVTTQLARRYGVTVSTIYHIARGWTWR